jgi:splicing factor 3B subunit 3
VNIEVMGQRIFCSDVHESVHFVRYKQAENQLITFADDIIPRHVHTTCLLDYDTIAVADKFGSISIVSVFSNISFCILKISKKISSLPK